MPRKRAEVHQKINLHHDRGKGEHTMALNIVQKIINQYAVVRKSFDYLQHVPREVRRLGIKEEDYIHNPPVLANSFPKSGTHLLLQILKAIPEITHYGTFIASKPTLSYRERSEEKHIRLLRRIIPGEVVPAHLFYEKQYHDILRQQNCVHFFIYRDLRDVVVSEAFYLSEMNRWHRLHPYFASLAGMEERIMTAIRGISDPGFSGHYPHVAERFSNYQGWVNDPQVCTVRFEDLVSSDRKKHLKRMADYYLRHSSLEIDVDKLVVLFESSIQPEKSHTYRKGKAGGWANVFTGAMKDQMKAIAGDLLINLGYEQDMNW